jgi:hypothetical protein
MTTRPPARFPLVAQVADKGLRDMGPRTGTIAQQQPHLAFFVAWSPR